MDKENPTEWIVKETEHGLVKICRLVRCRDCAKSEKTNLNGEYCYRCGTQWHKADHYCGYSEPKNVY